MGYNTELFVEPPSENFMCLICREVVKDPKECSECEVTYCNLCIQQLLETTPEAPCPNCKKEFVLKEMHRVTKNLLFDLKVKCLLCTWTGTLDQYKDTHLKEAHPDQFQEEKQEETKQLEEHKELVKSSQSSLAQGLGKMFVKPLTEKESSKAAFQYALAQSYKENWARRVSNLLTSKEDLQLSKLCKKAGVISNQVFRMTLGFDYNFTNEHHVIINNAKIAHFTSQHNDLYAVAMLPPKVFDGPSYIWSFKVLEGEDWIFGIGHLESIREKDFLVNIFDLKMYGFGWSSKSAKIIYPGLFHEYGQPIQPGDYVTIKVNTKKNRMKFAINKEWQGIAMSDLGLDVVDRKPYVAGKLGKIRVESDYLTKV